MASMAAGISPRMNAWCIGGAGIVALVIVAMVSPGLRRSRMIVDEARENRAELSLAPSPYVDKVRGGAMASMAAALLPEGRGSNDAGIDRKMVRTSAVDLVVAKPAEAAEKIRALAEGMGGFLVSSEVSGGTAASGAVTIRVPAARFEEARAEIRRLGLRVESEKVEAQDVTRQYVDQDAGLRNLRSEEAQYLTILKQARTVKDTMEVSEKLGEVRGQIDAQQAEFDALAKQIETVAITVSLRAESEAQVWGLHWRPLYQVKLALRDGLEALAGYGAAMVAILFYLPAVILWAGTILVCAAVGWKGLRWVGRVLFGWGGRVDAVKA